LIEHTGSAASGLQSVEGTRHPLLQSVSLLKPVNVNQVRIIQFSPYSSL